MKKIILFLMSVTFFFSAFCQRKSLFIVKDSLDLFGISLPANHPILDSASAKIWILTAPASSLDNIATSSKRFVAGGSGGGGSQTLTQVLASGNTMSITDEITSDGLNKASLRLIEGTGASLNYGTFLSDPISTIDLSLGQAQLFLIKNDFTKSGGLGLFTNDVDRTFTGGFTNYPARISSQNGILRKDVINSISLGGVDIVNKTDNTAYVNKLGFNTGEFFETLLEYTTATQDNTLTLPNKTGELATLNDSFFTGTLSSANGYWLGGSLFVHNATSVSNVSVGQFSGENNTGVNNSFFGFQAGRENLTGFRNCFFGGLSGNDNSLGNQNTSMGYQSGRFNQLGNDNATYGYQSGLSNQGDRNSFFGTNSGLMNVSGTDLTLIGYNATTSLTNFVNASAIGSNSYVESSNALILGSINGVNGATQDTRVGIGTSNPDASTILDLSSTTKGFRLPLMTVAERDLIASPADGLQIYNSTDEHPQFFNGVEWVTMGELSYATMGYSDSTVTVNLSTGVYSDITNLGNNLYTVGVVSGNAITLQGDSILINKSADYEIVWNQSFEGSAGDDFHFHVFINDLKVENFGAVGEETNNNTTGTTSSATILNFSNGDVVKLKIANIANNDDAIFHTGNILIKEL